LGIGSIEAKALKMRLDAGEVVLVDVREVWELERAQISGARHIPLGELSERLEELPRERELVFVCHLGVRSMQACFVAQSAGFRVCNLVGGIEAWSNDVDPGVPRY
jgi:rhodanese-related sulfurtransferase